jgi:hypothetical protein
MKKTLVFLVILAACNNATEQEVAETDTTDIPAIQVTTTEATTTQKPAVSTFDITTIPISDKDLGAFPFFSFPKGIKPTNKPQELEFDRIYFPLADVMTPLEGRTFKTYLSNENSTTWSLAFVEKSYDEAITAVGGVKIFDGKVSKEELDRIKDQSHYLGGEGNMHYYNRPVKVYVIRRSKGDDVYVQFSGSNSGGAIRILQKEAFKQTVTPKK